MSAQFIGSALKDAEFIHNVHISMHTAGQLKRLAKVALLQNDFFKSFR